MVEKIKCTAPPVYRYTWPGQDEALCCEDHGRGILVVANAIGMHLQMIPLANVELEGLDLTCSSMDEKREGEK